ncbi:MAG: sulfite exporter TauE/SafE family protein [Desulfuromonadaceae bacterium]|nr:sulfite exporter TauE/SafE family protein [Desulfuromonadaceae bacterium]
MAEFTFPVLCLLGFIGCFAGFLAGLLGLGGGIIYIPMFLWAFNVFGVSPEVIVHVAFGTSLGIIFPTAISSSLVHLRNGHIRLDQIGRLAIGSALGALVGAKLAAATPGIWLKALFGLMLLGIALRIFFSHPQMPDKNDERITFWRLVMVGFAGGSFAAFFGVSGAVVVLPLLLLTLRQPMHTAIASSSALMVISCFVGMLSYMMHGWGNAALPSFSFGFVNILVVAVCAPSTTFFARLGAHVAHRFSHDRLVKIFAVVLVLVGLRMVGSVFFFS